MLPMMLMAQIATGDTAIAGIMAESFIEEGNQKVVADTPLEYGKSITDACLHWADSGDVAAQAGQSIKKPHRLSSNNT